MAKIVRSPLINTHWLSKALATAMPNSLRVIEATWKGPGTTEGREIYNRHHIPGSLYFDLNKCSDPTSPYKITLPSESYFSDFVSELGIGNDTHVVVCEHDTVNRIKATPRVWWMFRVFGHDTVSILDGGVQQWIADGFPVTNKESPIPEKSQFNTSKRMHLHRSLEDVIDCHGDGQHQVVDSRPLEWYDGSMPNLLKGLKLGKIQSSVSIPFQSLLQEGSSKFQSPDDLKNLFDAKGIDLSRPLTSYCNIGVTAAAINLAAYMTGKEDTAVYDGSWEEIIQRAPSDMMDITPDPAAAA